VSTTVYEDAADTDVVRRRNLPSLKFVKMDSFGTMVLEQHNKLANTTLIAADDLAANGQWTIYSETTGQEYYRSDVKSFATYTGFLDQIKNNWVASTYGDPVPPTVGTHCGTVDTFAAWSDSISNDDDSWSVCKSNVRCYGPSGVLVADSYCEGLARPPVYTGCNPSLSSLAEDAVAGRIGSDDPRQTRQYSLAAVQSSLTLYAGFSEGGGVGSADLLAKLTTMKTNSSADDALRLLVSQTLSVGLFVPVGAVTIDSKSLLSENVGYIEHYRTRNSANINVASPTCPSGVAAACCDVDGSCTDGTDEWCCDGTFHCSNDGYAYAVAKGGSLCGIAKVPDGLQIDYSVQVLKASTASSDALAEAKKIKDMMEACDYCCGDGQYPVSSALSNIYSGMKAIVNGQTHGRRLGSEGAVSDLIARQSGTIAWDYGNPPLLSQMSETTSLETVLSELMATSSSSNQAELQRICQVDGYWAAQSAWLFSVDITDKTVSMLISTANAPTTTVQRDCQIVGARDARYNTVCGVNIDLVCDEAPDPTVAATESLSGITCSAKQCSLTLQALRTSDVAQGFRVTKVSGDVRDTYSACACPDILAYEMASPEPVATVVRVGVNGGGQGGAYCNSDGVTGYDPSNADSALFYCKEELVVPTAAKEEMDLVPIISGAVGGVFAVGLLVMIYNRQGKQKKHAVGNVPGMRKHNNKSDRKGWSAGNIERPLGPPPIINDPVSKEYGLGASEPSAGTSAPSGKGVKNPIMTDALERHDSF